MRKIKSLEPDVQLHYYLLQWDDEEVLVEFATEERAREFICDTNALKKALIVK